MQGTPEEVAKCEKSYTGQFLKPVLDKAKKAGQYVDIEELRNLGFNEVKVARDIILTIDKDPVKYDEMKKIVTMSKKNNIAVAAVGVENEKQLKMLKQLDEDMMVQGYFLYKPLSKSDLIAALISYEK